MSSPKPLDADDLLALAVQHVKGPSYKGWFARLAPEHQAVAAAAREKWLAGGGPEGPITAIALAISIREWAIGLGYRVPGADEIRRWVSEAGR